MNNLKKNLSNAIGWRTSCKIVVIESDDWGSIRTRSKKDYDAMLVKGLDVDCSNFTAYDCLESNNDLENLYDLLCKHKDSTQRPVVLTPMCIMANPNFDKIKESYFQEYDYENFVDTCKRYPNNDRVLDLWRKGIDERLYVPALHGREHLNAARWTRALQNGNEGLLTAFEHHSFGVSSYKGERLPDYLAAFDPATPSDIPLFDEIIESAAELFKKNCGYLPKHFIASNSPEPKSLENVLNKVGVKYLNRYKLHRYPLGDGKFTQEINWLGKQNKLKQIYLTRNCGFEPSDPLHNDWVDICLREIDNAFKWFKPAVISSHRVNYVGSINPKNAAHGLNELDLLLSNILRRWSNVEFMTSMELGDLISSSRR